MVGPIISQVIKRVPYIGPVIQTVGLAMDTKIIARRFMQECTPPALFIGSHGRKVKNRIRQNKKVALINFLFPAFELEVSNHSEDQIKNIKKIQNFELLLKSLQDEVHSLKEKITILESQRNRKLLLDVSKIDEKISVILEQEYSSFKQYSDRSDLSNTSLQDVVESESLSEVPKTTVKAFTTTEQ